MKMTKRFVSFALAVMMLSASSSVAFATDLSAPEAASTPANAVQPRLVYSSSFDLNPTTWTDLITDNNLLPAVVTITSHIKNTGNVSFRIYDESGKQIGSDLGPIEPGTSIDTETIGAFSGVYTIQGKASTEGRYQLSFHD